MNSFENSNSLNERKREGNEAPNALENLDKTFGGGATFQEHQELAAANTEAEAQTAEQLDEVREQLEGIPDTGPKAETAAPEDEGNEEFKIKRGQLKDLGETISPVFSAMRSTWDVPRMPAQIQSVYAERFRDLGSKVNQYLTAVESLKPTSPDTDFGQLDTTVGEIKSQVEELKNNLMVEMRKFNRFADDKVPGAQESFDATQQVLRMLKKVEDDLTAQGAPRATI